MEPWEATGEALKLSGVSVLPGGTDLKLSELEKEQIDAGNFFSTYAWSVDSGGSVVSRRGTGVRKGDHGLSLRRSH